MLQDFLTSFWINMQSQFSFTNVVCIIGLMALLILVLGAHLNLRAAKKIAKKGEEMTTLSIIQDIHGEPYDGKSETI